MDLLEQILPNMVQIFHETDRDGQIYVVKKI